jgi:hypothetical protein
VLGVGPRRDFCGRNVVCCARGLHRRRPRFRARRGKERTCTRVRRQRRGGRSYWWRRPAQYFRIRSDTSRCSWVPIDFQPPLNGIMETAPAAACQSTLGICALNFLHLSGGR